MIRRSRLAWLVLLTADAVLLAAQTPAPTSQAPTFRAEVQYVEVDALVTDGQGHAVRGLTKDDFRLLEDGRQQTISTLSFVDIPVERDDRPVVAAQPVEPDMRTNARPFDGRMYVMVIDDLHTSALQTQLVRKAARQFIERNLGADDLMAVIHTFGPTDASQELTSNKRLLLAAVDRTAGQELESAALARNEQYLNNPYSNASGGAGALTDPYDAERGLHARSTLEVLRKVSDWFAGVRGRRKSILFVSEGIDYDISDVFMNQQASSIISETQEVIASAARAGVSIYGIDPRGLVAVGDASIGTFADADTSAAANDSTADASSSASPSPDANRATSTGMVAPSQIGMRALVSELQLSQDSLRTLSDETGGFAVVNRNQFADAYRRIVEDNSAYYLLAYYPSSVKPDGKYHKIDVQLNRPGLTVRARKGWVAPQRKAPAIKPDPIRDALNSPLPVTGLTMQVFAVPFKGTPPDGSVLLGVELIGRNLKLTNDDRIELSFVAIDANDKVHSGGKGVTLNLAPDAKARVQATALRLFMRTELPPGRYQLRMAAREEASGLVGSVLSDLEIPDFAKGPIVMSGLALTSTAAGSIPTTRPDEQLQTVLPDPPTGVRAFLQGDELALFAEVYDNVPATPHKIFLTATLTTEGGRVVFTSHDDVRDSTDLQQGRRSYGYTTRIPLSDLAPGPYVLRVEARGSLGRDAPVSRQVPIMVLPSR